MSISPPPPPSVTNGRHRSRSLSSIVPPPPPITLPIKFLGGPPTSLSLSTSATSSTSDSSAGTGPGNGVSVGTGTTGSETFSPSDEYRRAFHHARSASMSSSTKAVDLRVSIAQVQSPTVVGLSCSPESASSSEDDDVDPKTPLSTSPVLLVTGATPGLGLDRSNTGATTNGSAGTGATLNPSASALNRKARSEPDATLTIHELSDEDDDGDLDPRAYPISLSSSLSQSLSSSSAFASPLFANGARWGFPQSSTSTTGTTAAATGPSPPNLVPLRRASLGPTSPANERPLVGFALGRVNSNGATGTASGPAASVSPPTGTGAAGSAAATGSQNGGFGLFRRMSVGGFGSGGATRPKPPSPPSSFINLPASTPSASPIPASAPAAPSIPISIPAAAPAPAPAPIPTADRGRRASMNSGMNGRPKRKISPMGERMLGGSFGMH